jgi:Tfp pilus assembly protein PilX
MRLGADIGRGMLRRLANDEQGIALVLALTTLLVLSSLTASVLVATAVNHRNAKVSSDANHAFALAEEGLAYGEGRLYSAATSGQAMLVPDTSFSQDGGTVSYSGTLTGSTWTIVGTGRYGTASRTVSAQATVPEAQTVLDPTIWNYMYVDNPTASCGLQYSGSSATITVPLYSRGDVCLSGSSLKYNGADLEVGRALDFSGSSIAIGTSQQPISKVNVVGSCAWSPCDSAHGLWVAPPGLGHTLDPVLSMPVVDFQDQWATSNPGPKNPCQAGSGVPSPFFDNDAATTTGPNNSLGTINLFPSGHSYDCKVGSSELKWNGSNALTVNGSFYFDGNINISGSSVHITYTGRGTIYASGTISVSGSSLSFCGASPCSNWNPNATDASGNYVGNELIFVAGCYVQNTSPTNPVRLSTSSTCESISGSSLTWQVGSLVEGHVQFSGSSLAEQAPVIADTADLSGSSLTQMLPFHGLPPGAPSDTKPVTPVPTAPTNWNG